MSNKARMLIAQIGRGSYQITNYAVLKNGGKPENCKFNPNAVYTTGYTFEAVFQELQNKLKPLAPDPDHQEMNDHGIDTIVLIGTESSYWGSLCSYYLGWNQKENSGQTEGLQQDLAPVEINPVEIKLGNGSVRMEYSIKAINDPDHAARDKVEEVLTRAFQKKYDCRTRVRIIILEKGIAEDEIIQNFTLLQDGLTRIQKEYYEDNILVPWEKGNDENHPEIEIYFDISNGFRSLPTYIYSFTSYLTRLNKETYKMFMYYGMFDAKAQYGGQDKFYAPLVELDEITDLMQWINAINEFHNMGVVTELIKIFDEHQEWNVNIRDDKYQNLKQVFEMFEYASNAHNLKVLEETIAILSSLDNLDRKTEKGEIPKQAVVMLQDIADDFTERFARNQRYPYSNLTLRLAEWFYEQERLGSAAIAVMEGITTYLLERFCNDPKKEYDYDIIEAFSIREPVKNILMQDAQKEDREGDFGDAYEIIRKNIRNIGAHILYTDVEYDVVRSYKDNIKKVLDDMFADMKQQDDENSLFYVLKEPIITKFQEEKDRLKEKRKGTSAKKTTTKAKFRASMQKLKQQEVPEDTFSLEMEGALKELRSQVLQMAEYEDKGDAGFKEFMDDLANMPVLKTCLDEWMKHDWQPDVDQYRLKFGADGRKKKKKTGSDRLLGYYSTHEELFREIVEKSRKK